MKKLLLSGMAGVGLLLAAGFCVQSMAETVPAVPDEPVAITGSKKTVMFPHKTHASIDCVTCHHEVDNKPTYQKCATSGCHDDLAARKGERSLYYVMHGKADTLKHATCLSCHGKIIAEKPDLKKIMTGCTQSACHPAVKNDGKKAGDA